MRQHYRQSNRKQPPDDDARPQRQHCQRQRRHKNQRAVQRKVVSRRKSVGVAVRVVRAAVVRIHSGKHGPRGIIHHIAKIGRCRVRRILRRFGSNHAGRAVPADERSGGQQGNNAQCIFRDSACYEHGHSVTLPPPVREMTPASTRRFAGPHGRRRRGWARFASPDRRRDRLAIVGPLS